MNKYPVTIVKNMQVTSFYVLVNVKNGANIFHFYFSIHPNAFKNCFSSYYSDVYRYANGQIDRRNYVSLFIHTVILR